MPKRFYRFRLLIVTLSALLCALTAYCVRTAGPPQWQARATYALSGPEIPQALPGLLSSGEFTGHSRIAAHRIPGTRLLELSCTAASGEESDAGLKEAAGLLPRLYGYLGLDAPDSQLLHSALSRMPEDGDTLKLCILSGMAGAVIAAMILYPPLENRAPIPLNAVLAGCFRRLRRGWPIALALCLVLSAGSLTDILTRPPRWEVTALVSLENDNRDSTAISKTLTGLLDSDLVDEGIFAQPLAGSNLFCLTARGASPAEARALLDSFLGDWPHLARFLSDESELTLLQQPFHPDRATHIPAAWEYILGPAGGIFLYFAGCLLLSLEEQRRTAVKC